MARRRRGFQEGIDVPNTLGGPLTTWQDPTPTPTKAFSFSPQNTGAQRNYGSTPAYVDTVPHRWKVGERTMSGSQIQSNLTTRAKNSEVRAAENEARDIRDAEDLASATELGISVETLRYRRSTVGREARRRRDRDIAMSMEPPGPALGGEPPSEGLPMPSPEMARTGRPVPAPPSDAPAAPTGTPTLDRTPLPPRRAEEAPWMTSEPDVSTAGDPFMEGLRRAPSTPMESPVEWKDDPSMDTLGMPRPRMTTESTSPEAQAETARAWMRDFPTGPLVSPPSSRTRRRGL